MIGFYYGGFTSNEICYIISIGTRNIINFGIIVINLGIIILLNIKRYCGRYGRTNSTYNEIFFGKIKTLSFRYEILDFYI